MSHLESIQPTDTPEQNNGFLDAVRQEIDPGPGSGNLREMKGPPNMMDQKGPPQNDNLPNITIEGNDVNVDIHINSESCNDSTATGEGSGGSSAEKQDMPPKKVTDPFGPKGPGKPEDYMNLKSKQAPDGTSQDKEVRPSVEPNGLVPNEGQSSDLSVRPGLQSENTNTVNQSII